MDNGNKKPLEEESTLGVIVQKTESSKKSRLLKFAKGASAIGTALGVVAGVLILTGILVPPLLPAGLAVLATSLSFVATSHAMKKTFVERKETGYYDPNLTNEQVAENQQERDRKKSMTPEEIAQQKERAQKKEENMQIKKLIEQNQELIKQNQKLYNSPGKNPVTRTPFNGLPRSSAGLGRGRGIGRDM